MNLPSWPYIVLPQNLEECNPIIGTVLKLQTHYQIVNLVVKMQAIQQHIPISLLLGSTPSPLGLVLINLICLKSDAV